MTRSPSAENLAAFRRDGFLVVRAFLGGRAVQDLLRWTGEIAAAPEVRGQHMVYYEDNLTDPGQRIVQRIENFCPFHSGFDRLLREGEPVTWASALLGGAGFKPHQDQQAGWSAYAPLFLTAMLTIDETTLENGCLELAAGRHRGGLVGEEWQPLAGEGIGLKPVPTHPGDVIFFDSFVPHASGPNRSMMPRRVLYVTYAEAAHGDHRARYFADKRRDFPPDIEREPGRIYTFRL